MINYKLRYCLNNLFKGGFAMYANYEKTIENIRGNLLSGSHNFVCETVEGTNGVGFLTECIVGSGKRFFLKIRVDADIDSVIYELYYNLSIPEQYRSVASEYCMKVIESKKAGYVAVSPDTGSVYSAVSSSFQDAPLSDETLDELELIVFTMFISTYDDFQLIAGGTDPIDNASDLAVDVLKQLENKSASGNEGDIDVDIMELIHRKDKSDDADS